MDYGYIIKSFPEEEALEEAMLQNTNKEVILEKCKKIRLEIASITREQIEETTKELNELYENYVVQIEEKKGTIEELQRLEEKRKDLKLKEKFNKRKSKATSTIQYLNIFKYDKKRINVSGNECECDDTNTSSCKCTIIENISCNCV